MSRINPRVVLLLVGFLLYCQPSQAQFTGGGQASIIEAQGDYLEHVGSFLQKEAIADSYNIQNSIVLNEYLSTIAKMENQANAIHRAEMIARQKDNYDKVVARIRTNPDDHDLASGDALNDLMSQMLNPSLPASSFRTNPVILPGETIRGIPFFHAPEDATFSMRRLSAKGIWPVGLHDKRLAGARKDYERAFDDALDQQIDGKLSREAILKVEKCLDTLNDRLSQVLPASGDKVYVEARTFLRKLSVAKELLKREKIEEMVGQIDKYSGTSVYDLITFMQKYNLRFGVPDVGFEREQYARIHEAMKVQLDLVAKEGAPTQHEIAPTASEPAPMP